MDRLRIGRSVRPIRIRLNLTQAETAHRAGVSRPYVSRIERGLIGSTDFDSVERVCRALGADLDVRVRWRGEGLDLLLDEAHATLVDLVVRLLGPLGWTTALEVTFNAYGERGSIDVLAWQPTTRALLVVEVKSVFADAQGTLLPLDRKARLGRAIAADRTWEAASVSRLLVL
ncbi:MAG TPA: helix-turn-helix transcriptional regulator, partial [Candidatus Limnocylindrales bacterium]